MAVNDRNAGAANGSAERDPALERLYREAAGETPPAHLDAAILAAARREVGARPRAFVPALRHWHVPISIAAVVIVSVSLVILVREEERIQVRDTRAPEAAIRGIEQAAAPPTPPTPAEAEMKSVGPQASMPEPRQRESRDDVRYSRTLSDLAEPARRDSGPPAAPEPAAKSMAQPVQAAPPSVAEERAAPARSDAVVAGRMATVPAPGEPRAARSTADAPQAKAMARSELAKSAEQDRLPVWHGFEKEPPEKWLAHIQELGRQGRTADAEEMLSEFKRRFPQHPLPPGPK